MDKEEGRDVSAAERVGATGLPAVPDGFGFGPTLYDALRLRLAARLTAHMNGSEQIVLRSKRHLFAERLATLHQGRELALEEEMARRNYDLQEAEMHHELRMAKLEVELNRAALQCENFRSQRLQLAEGTPAGLPGGIVLEDSGDVSDGDLDDEA